MPLLGHVGRNFVEGSTREQRDLASALCDVYQCLEKATLAVNAKRLIVSPSALSGYLNARHVPQEELVGLLHAAARADSGQKPPWSLDALERMRAEAKRPCPRCRDRELQKCDQCGHQVATCGEDPPAAVPSVRRRWSRNTHGEPGSGGRKATGRPAGPVGGNGPELPVPLPEGDRQGAVGLPPLEPGLEEALGYLLEGRDRDAHLVLAEAGDKLPVHRIPDVVMACRGRGFAVAADAVLHSAARRPHREVLRIVRLFNSARYYEEADLVLKTATAD
ncbi:hypothetical protein ABTX81_20530 [Kitasatospora sp. NPDC097605]|uniref:hypothetical protein n=1 Tax=Kitasatospora sp. NPDC097605 TaxID=3157226 RepID=UPI00331A7582